MSNAILKGNASGTGSVTLESPATNSDRTIALPDSDGSLVYANASGNVGIGTTNPAYKLDVNLNNGATAGPAYPLVVTSTTTASGNTNASGIGFINFTRAGGAIDAVRTNPAADYGSALVFKTNNTGEATGTLAALTERGRFDASGNFLFNSGYGSVATAYGCRAWVNFNGTGTVAIRASGNVSSITDNGTGNYAVNYTNAMPDTNYSIVSTSRNAGVGPTFSSTTTTATSNSFVGIYDAAGTVVDANNISVAVFR